jgi:hypothetical protein
MECYGMEGNGMKLYLLRRDRGRKRELELHLHRRPGPRALHGTMALLGYRGPLARIPPHDRNALSSSRTQVVDPFSLFVDYLCVTPLAPRQVWPSKQVFCARVKHLRMYAWL